jgi:hypothetical protein
MRARISGLPGSRICDGLPGCLPPVRIGLVRPAHGDFYFQAFNGSVALPVAGYNYNSDWTPLLAGLSPAGMAASLAAPEPYVRLSRIRLPPRVCDGKTFCMTSRAPSPGTRSVASSSSKWPARIANTMPSRTFRPDHALCFYSAACPSRLVFISFGRVTAQSPIMPCQNL